MTMIRSRAWWVPAAVALLLLVFGVGDAAVGAAADPGISLAIVGRDPATLQATGPDAYRMFDFAARSGGVNLALLGLLVLVVILVPYRRGDRWAWLALWLLPAWAILVPIEYLVYGLAAGQPPAPPMISGPIVALLTAGALLVDRERFRPRG